VVEEKTKNKTKNCKLVQGARPTFLVNQDVIVGLCQKIKTVSQRLLVRF